MAWPLRLRPLARRDIRIACDWCETQRSGLGDEFLADLESRLRAIADSPLSFPVVYERTRRARVSRFSFGIYFRVTTHAIDIVAVLHDRRDPAVRQVREPAIAHSPMVVPIL